MSKAEPPLSFHRSASVLFLIGRNRNGQWVVRDPSGLRGGLFIDRAQALRYALFENGHQPQAVVMVPGVLELDFAPPASAPRLVPSFDRDSPRKAA